MADDEKKPFRPNSLKEIKKTLMEGSQSSATLDVPSIIWRQISTINFFQSTQDPRFITAVDALEDMLWPDLDEEYRETVKGLESTYEKEVRKTEAKYANQPDLRSQNISFKTWSLTRLKFRALQKCIQAVGYWPSKDVVQDDEIDKEEAAEENEEAGEE